MRNRQTHASHTKLNTRMQTPLTRPRTSCAHAYTPLQVPTHQRVFGAAHELVELHCALICKLLPINPYNPHSNAHKMAATDRQTDRQTQTQTHTACRKQDCQRNPRLRFDGQFIILASGVFIHDVQKRTLSMRTVVPIGHHAPSRDAQQGISCALAWPHQKQKQTRMPTGAISLRTTLFFAYVHASRPETFSYS